MLDLTFVVMITFLKTTKTTKSYGKVCAESMKFDRFDFGRPNTFDMASQEVQLWSDSHEQNSSLLIGLKHVNSLLNFKSYLILKSLCSIVAVSE